MTTAFVLGGGGVLGAVEVGMLRALFERGITPDLVLGTSVGALNGAMVARQPDGSVVETLTELWQGAGLVGPDVYGDRPLRTVRRAVATGTHLWSAQPLKQALLEELGDLTFEELPVRFQVCAASIERAAEHWFDSGSVVDAVVASAAVPGLLPPAQVGDEHYLDGGIVNSIPLGRADPGRSPASPSRSRAGTASTGSSRSCPPTWRRTCCRRVAPPPRTTPCSAAATSRGCRSGSTSPTRRRWSIWTNISGRCSRATREPRDALGRAAPGDRAVRDRPGPAALAHAAALDRRGRGALADRVGPAAAAALRVGGLRLRDVRGAAAGRDVRAVVGLRVRVAAADAVLPGHPLRPGAGHDVGVLRRGPAGAAAAHRDRGPDPGRAPRPADPRVLPPRRAGRLLRADPHADGVVRPRAAGGPEGHARVGPDDLGGAEPDPGPLHHAEPGTHRGP